MLKGLSRFWIRSLIRAGKVQQTQATKLIKNLLVKPKSKSKIKDRPATKLNTKLNTTPRTTASFKPGTAATRPATTSRTQKSAKPSSSGKWLTSYYSSIENNTVLPLRRMSYCLYLPTDFPKVTLATPAQSWPLIVMLHGCEQTASAFSQGTRMNQLAETKGYAVLYPQQSLRSHPNRCWRWYDKASQDGGGDVTMIVGMIEKVARQYAIDRTRIYLCGMSAGAAMANIVALNHPDLIAAIGLHSGPVFGAGHNPISAYGVMQHGAGSRVKSAIAEVQRRAPAFPGMPTILIHGQDDKTVRPVNQAQLAQQSLLLNHLAPDSGIPIVAKAAGKPGSRHRGHAYDIADFYLRKNLLLRVARIMQLEHAWSGGDASLPFNSAAGPDASKMMLDFFSKHRRLDTSQVSAKAADNKTDNKTDNTVQRK